MAIQLRVTLRLLGSLLTFFSLAMLPSMAVSLYYDDGEIRSFAYTMVLLLALGALLWTYARGDRSRAPLRLRDGFIVVSMSWISLGLAGAVPLYLSGIMNLSIADALFESISGLTTTGSTVLTGIDQLPESIRFYRQFLQWLGGLGIVLLAVAILPLLGLGGMHLYHAEAPHSLSERRLTPRITGTAKVLWYLYLGMTVICAGAYWLAGMSLFDAVCHSFSTIAIGGASTHDANFGYFDNVYIEAVAIVFMVLAGVNFGLHYRAIWHQRLRAYTENGEFVTYIVVLCVTAALCLAYLALSGFYADGNSTVRHGIFQTVSVATTTGFTTTGFHQWPAFASTLILLASFIGGCMGSTGGGLKVIRFLLVLKHGRQELSRILHPTMQVAFRVGNMALNEDVLKAVWAFLSAYIFVFLVLFLLLLWTGLDHITAASAMVATLNNLGPGLGEVSTNYSSLGDTSKLLLCMSMLFGRLEIFPLLLILTPAFWRR